MPALARACLALSLALAQGCDAAGDGGAAAPVAPIEAVRVDHSAFDAILAQVARPDGVDYLQLRRDLFPKLAAYLDQLAAVNPYDLRPVERLAYCINLYNATVLCAVAERLRSGYAVSASEFGLFEEALVPWNGGRITLNELENEKIRKGFREPRIHAALVCGARSCPLLQPRAWPSGAEIDTLFDDAMRGFLAGNHNAVDRERKELKLSRLFEWYAEDFGGADRVAEYAASYLGSEVAAFGVAFAEYDWSPNLAAPASGKWAVAESGAPLFDAATGGARSGAVAEGEYVEVLEDSAGRVRVRRGLAAGEGWADAAALEPARF